MKVLTYLFIFLWVPRGIYTHYPDQKKVTMNVTQVNTIVPGVAKWLMSWTDGPYNNTFPNIDQMWLHD